jgi:3-hydroxybutyryl-CoA dehydrogenase
MPNSIQTIGIVGSGVMGAGIAQLFAQAGCEIRLHDSNEAALSRAMDNIRAIFARLVEKQKLGNIDADLMLARIHPVADLADLAGCDLVIEAIVERLDAKQQLFARLAALLGPETMLATNTSSLSVAAIGDGLPHPERFVGLHFFNPVPLMKLVEIIPTARTGSATVAAVETLVAASGHRAVKAVDYPGFIVNHLGRAYVTEGLAILEEGVCDAPTLDRVLRDSLGFRMGPAELLDLTGLDVTVPVMESIYAGFYGEPRLRPAALGRHRLLNGLLGRKAGEGFYRYAEGRRVDVPADVRGTGPMPSLHLVEMAQTPGVLAWVEATGARIVPIETADLVIVAPLGGDVTEAVVAAGLDASRTIGIDGLFSTAGFATLAATPATSAEARAAVRGLLAVAPGALIEDSCGFIAQRMIAAIVNLAADMAQKRIAAPADIDIAVTIALGYPHGPFAWADAIGLETILKVSERLFAVTGDPRYRPSPWLRRRARLGLPLGHP